MERASWHFSSFGGVESLLTKMRSNSYRFPEELLNESEMRLRMQDCTPNVALSEQFKNNLFWRTDFNSSNLPSFPDVPRHVARELERGRMQDLIELL